MPGVNKSLVFHHLNPVYLLLKHAISDRMEYPILKKHPPKHHIYFVNSNRCRLFLLIEQGLSHYNMKHTHPANLFFSFDVSFFIKQMRQTICEGSSGAPTSIDLNEGHPSSYLFIFVNPLSGDKKGEDLVTLPIQHFRLRRLPRLQVEIYNILDEEERDKGVKHIQLVQSLFTSGQLLQEEGHGISSSVKKRQIHVWSAGGDGTVMSVFELLVENQLNLDLIFFSCIPFGTGNDFSQVLGWGRTLNKKDICGAKLQYLEEIILDRLQNSEPARLDVWEVEMTSYPDGYVTQSGPKERRDGHDVAEVKKENQDNHKLIRKMSNYMSIGVQGYVGNGFEAHRAGNRWANILIYAKESFKWVFFRKFPNLNHFLKSISQSEEEVVVFQSSEKESFPKVKKDLIDLIIQNIPHIWGKEVDLWGEAESGLECVANRSGPTNPKQWKPQLANDGQLEIMLIENMKSYLKKIMNMRRHVSRIGQFKAPLEINFLENNINQKQNIICIMCDGEFYEMKNPKSISFTRYKQIWTLGRDDKVNQGRLVADELHSEHVDIV
ncbi:ATP-NAD kinase-like domain-containing protein [Pilobolus umbonatus]|nr:ATP-NAD kinase-like domain-containing protein [Pilobolus umbonatus]